MNARILIAEDDDNIRLGLIATLESEGYQVTAASDGAQALKLYPQLKYDLVILDIMMPRQSGYDVCRELRQRDARLPILFLSAKSEEIDKVLGLRLGADDYVTKPFGVRELLARVEAILRRTRAANPGVDNTPSLPHVLVFGAATIDRRQFTVALPGRKPEALTARELKLLETFASHPNEVLPRDALLNAVWGVGYYGTTRTLDQHVAQVRKKVEQDPETPRTLLTVHGVGYRYVQAGQATAPLASSR
jgi:DNA-binding response OmpR family regulator